ncbi:dTDP-4-dehydrorhamnose reductase family protein [Paenibacillus physcomitrellae]|uniref:dTDP-4-dehydrorhamnose reductase n=1 Tax=Paenibacillus physcomitrellae TaxID=1619311 RepID=A0ABQ1G253_9BACL|nr:SDR family oxidoreductase [Paenibacillus physcomitrellae]GGA35949.1 NAD(P)-dependent oxidoreductase [Paenibacillus physcomitrellae]
MKLLIFGGNGMAGHILVQYFRESASHHVFYTTRDAADNGGILLDVQDPGKVEQAVALVRPDVIINAVGVLNQFAERDVIGAYEINGLLPHRLQRAADRYGARLIHISTDCVFLGDRGSYTEHDQPDGVSKYALTKALGEVKEGRHLTIRTSIIGPEIRRDGIGLMEWFLGQTGEVHGYQKVLWNGVTTLQLAKVIEEVLDQPLSGLIHLAHPEKVSKHDLLKLMQKVWNKQDVNILPEDATVLDRTLVSTRSDVAFDLPDYEAMLSELAEWMKQHG